MPRWLIWSVVVAAAYVLSAELGFSLAFSVRQVTAVWPPTGIAIAALALAGYRVWPGIFAGALIANAITGEGMVTAAAIAAGNTAGPLFGTYLLRRFEFRPTLARVHDVLVFVVCASILAMTVTATNGAAQLALAHIIPWSSYLSTWSLWWMGDAMGVLLVAPLILTWSRPWHESVMRGEAGHLEVLVFAASSVGMAFLEFFGNVKFAFPLYPFVIWSALRMGARVTSGAIVSIAIVSVLGTIHDHGPFQFGTIDQRLMALVAFTSVLSIVGLILSAITNERKLAFNKMHAAERRFQLLAQTVPQIVWMADATGSVDWTNDRWIQFSGVDRLTLPSDDWQQLIAAQLPFEREVLLRRHDGESKWFLLRGEPTFDEAGKIVRWYGTFTDIDDQRRALDRSDEIARTLQVAFMPQALPVHRDVRFDALYLTAESEALIGGDWYDAVTLPDGRILISIGDVTGHGLESAVIAGRIRQSVIATAMDVPDPAAILTKVNRLLQLRDEGMATALVAVLDVRAMTMHVANAGHPPPIVATPSSPAHALPYGSLPLGVSTSTEYYRQRVPLGPDTMVVFYTDGVTEFERDIETAETALCAALDRIVTSPPITGHPADAIREAVMSEATPSDDAVLMVIHVAPSVAASKLQRK